MASIGTATDSFLSQVEIARGDIKDKFSKAHDLLGELETALLSELDELSARYRGESIAAQLLQLSTSKEQLIATLKGNDNYITLKQSLSLLDSRIKELEDNLETSRNSMSGVVLEWDLELNRRIKKIGTIKVKGPMDYKKKEYPKCICCKHRPIESTAGEIFYSPKSVSIDAQTKDVYICDFGNNRVQVFNSSFHFLFMFSDRMNEPVGICVNQGKVYVVQSITHSLNVYNNAGDFLQSVGKKGENELEFQWPRGVDVYSATNLIYICDCNNNRVQCLNVDLSFNSFITNIYHPKDIKVVPGLIVILKKNSPCILQYNLSHQLIREIIHFGEKEKSVINPNYFCIDDQRNIVMTDQIAECVLVFSNSGELLHRFGKRGEGKGEFIGPRGIALDSENRIIVVSNNPENCVQIF